MTIPDSGVGHRTDKRAALHLIRFDILRDTGQLHRLRSDPVHVADHLQRQRDRVQVSGDRLLLDEHLHAVIFDLTSRGFQILLDRSDLFKLRFFIRHQHAYRRLYRVLAQRAISINSTSS